METEYFKITDPDLKDKIKNVYGEEAGTYILHWYKNDKPREIGRLLGTDNKGILYIGKTDTPLYKRVFSLQNSIKANSALLQPLPVEKGHKTLSKKFFRIRKRIDINDLYITVNRFKITPEEDESHLLDEYVSRLGELPPLNGVYGKYEHWDLF